MHSQLIEALKRVLQLAKSRFDPELKEAVQTLKDELSLTLPDFDPHKGAYWRFQAGHRDGPFCPKCFDEKRILRLMEKKAAKMICPSCNRAE